jgi:hypothetical protein
MWAQEKPPVKPAPSVSPDVLEFPVLMQQKVAAGSTPVGAKIQAKLAIATLVKRTVLPKDAVFSGEVTESVAKSGTAPSKLAIRMDSVQWKGGTMAVKVYLTAWVYPLRFPDAAGRGEYGAGNEVDRGTTAGGGGGASTIGEPISGRDGSDPGSPFPLRPVPITPFPSLISDHRVLIKNVESTRDSEGAVVLSNKRSNLKLDKGTVYVLAAGDLLPDKR